eukprot:GHRR01009007.1.p1 GENE.GHRR01009007.1~~GHRR01009007.1.p1  ORF type:complete len:208 (+),score=40.84 GHRR01009007.1:590-1213(+)
MLRSGAKAAPVDQLLSEAGPLDEDEQQIVIVALEEQILQQNRIFKRLFAVSALLFSAFFLHAAYQQYKHPWEQRYTGELRPVTTHTAVVLVLFSQGSALFACAVALLVQLPRKGQRSQACMPASMQVQLLLGSAVGLASVGSLYWGSAMWHGIARYGRDIGEKWELLWLPLAPLGYCLLCCYIVWSIGSTGKDVQQLKRMAYEFKKV